MFQDQQQKMNRIAIIGSGITGISVAFQHPLTSSITMFDKSRRPGGRVCTRTSRQHPGYSFDHGTPFIYPKGQFLDLLQRINAIKQLHLKYSSNVKNTDKETFQKKFYGGNPQIETIPLKLIQQLKNKTKLTLQFNTRITSIDSKSQNGQFVLQSEENKKFGPFDQVYVCIPFPQCGTLKQNCVQIPKLNGQSYYCAWVVMSAFDKNSAFAKRFGSFDIVKDIGEDISSMVNQKSKGNTSNDDLWVFTMNYQWCQVNKDHKPEVVQQMFKQKLKKVLDTQIEFKFIKAHRWLYSKPKENPTKPLTGKNIVFGGDWIGNRENVQDSWDLGPLLYQTMNKKQPNL